MKKIIFDTNVIISAILKGKNAYSTIDFAVSGNALICLSEDVEKEYYKVINYKKIQQIHGFLEDASSILQLLSNFSIHYNTFTKFNFIKDFPDNRFIELAAINSAHYLITGNTKDFDFPSFFETTIISPAQFCAEFNL